MAVVYLFDTSAVNRLHDDPEREPIVEGLCATNAVRVSALNVLEVAGTSEESKRIALLSLLKRLTGAWKPLEVPNLLVRRAMSAYAARAPGLECSVGDSTEGYWDLLVNPSEATEEDLGRLNTQRLELELDFRRGHESARPHFQRLFGPQSRPPRNAPTLLRKFIENREWLHRELVASLYEQQTGVTLPLDEMDELFRELPEIAAFLLGWAHSIHTRAIALEGFGNRNAGMIDLWSAAYLPRVDRFITADEHQYRALRLIARIVKPECTVLRYQHFRRRLFGGLQGPLMN